MAIWCPVGPLQSGPIEEHSYLAAISVAEPCFSTADVRKQGSSENDGRSDVDDRSEFKVVSNCCYPNCSYTNCGPVWTILDHFEPF